MLSNLFRKSPATAPGFFVPAPRRPRPPENTCEHLRAPASREKGEAFEGTCEQEGLASHAAYEGAVV